MKIGINSIIGVTTVATVMSCSSAKKEYASFELYPVRTGSLTEMGYTPEATKFTLGQLWLTRICSISSILSM